MMGGSFQIFELTEQLHVALKEIQRLKSALEQGPLGWLCSQCHLNADISGSRQAWEPSNSGTPTSTNISFRPPSESTLCEEPRRGSSTETAQGDTLPTTDPSPHQLLPAHIFKKCDGASPADTSGEADEVDGSTCQQSQTIRTDPDSHRSSETSGKGKKGSKSKKRGKDPTEWTRYPRRHVALRVMYLGERYCGFASQSASNPTVEGELFAALRRTKLMMASPSDALYSRCGRTDKGVNAHCQVVALFLRSKSHRPTPATATSPSTEGVQGAPSGRADPGGLAGAGEDGGGGGIRSGGPVDRLVMARASRSLEASCSSLHEEAEEIDYVAALNRALPADIRVMGWSPVPEGFSARFSCLRREYLYFFVRHRLDVEAMRDAARRFEGDHDFRNVAKMDAPNVSNFCRRIERFTVEPVWPEEGRGGCRVWALRVRGSAFLWHQVRCMAAVLLMVGRGGEAPTIVDELLDIGVWPAKPQYAMAHEAPLVLHSCAFEGLRFRCPRGSASMVRRHVEGLRDAAMVKLAVLQTALDSMGGTGERRCNPGAPTLLWHQRFTHSHATAASYHCAPIAAALRAEERVRGDAGDGEDGGYGAGTEGEVCHHIPLSKRPTEPTYDERVRSRSGKSNAE